MADDTGNPVRQPADDNAELHSALKALMFADDFTAVAASAHELQAVVDICWNWCRKWRMSANIGPKKSTYMIFAPENAAKSDRSSQIRWHTTVIPRVHAYNTLRTASIPKWPESGPKFPKMAPKISGLFGMPYETGTVPRIFGCHTKVPRVPNSPETWPSWGHARLLQVRHRSNLHALA